MTWRMRLRLLLLRPLKAPAEHSAFAVLRPIRKVGHIFVVPNPRAGDRDGGGDCQATVNRDPKAGGGIQPGRTGRSAAFDTFPSMPSVR